MESTGPHHITYFYSNNTSLHNINVLERPSYVIVVKYFGTLPRHKSRKEEIDRINGRGPDCICVPFENIPSFIQALRLRASAYYHLIFAFSRVMGCWREKTGNK